MGAGVMQETGRGRARTAARSRAQPMSEINVTPFVDVMLVLLIIFMVAAPLLTVGVPVELPKTAASALPTEQEEPLTVTVTADGDVQIQTTRHARRAGDHACAPLRRNGPVTAFSCARMGPCPIAPLWKSWARSMRAVFPTSGW